MKKFVSFVICLCASSSCLAKAPNPVRLISHKAVYDLSLKSTKGGASSVVYAGGKLKYSIQKVCNVWKTETVFSLDVSHEINGIYTTNWKQVTSESLDGCRFDFEVYTFQKGKDVKELAGTAWCEGNKKQVFFTLPLESEASFPKNVLFPVQQTSQLIQAALAGEKSQNAYVYDGSRLEALHLMHTMISEKPVEKDREKKIEGSKLLGGKSYWFDTAFYNDMGLFGNRDDGSPFYEVGLRYYDNGISDNVIQDFGTYKLQSTLKAVEELPEIPCDVEKK